MTFKPFPDETLQALEERCGRIDVFTPAPRPPSRWAKSDAAPEPDYEVVVRACTPGEWDNITGQINNDKQKARAARNLVMATVVGLSSDGVITMIDTAETDMRLAQKPVRAALETLMRQPGMVGLPESCFAKFSAFNGMTEERHAEKA